MNRDAILFHVVSEGRTRIVLRKATGLILRSPTLIAITTTFVLVARVLGGDQQPDAQPTNSLSDLRGIAGAYFNRDGSRVVVRMRSGAVGLWDSTTGSAVKGDLDPEASATCAVMSADGALVLIGFKENARVFDTTSSAAISPALDAQLRADLLTPAVFSRDGAVVVVFEQERASVWKVGTGERVAAIPLPPGPHDEAPPSAIFAGAGADCFLMNADGVVRRYDGKSWKPMGKPMRHPRFETAYEFSFKARADGKFIATMDDAGENGPKGQLQVWDAMTGKPLGAPLVTVNGFGVRFLPEADRILIQPARGDASVCELPSMKMAYKITKHDELDGPQIEVSQDGKWILCWGPDKTLHVIDAQTGKMAGNISSSAAITKILFGPESSVCYAVFDNTAFFLEDYHDNYVMKLSLPELTTAGSVRSLDYLAQSALSLNGERLLLVEGKSDHERIRLFDAATMRSLAPSEEAQ